MWIVQLALRRPYTFIVVALLLLIIGPLAILRTPTDIFPNINIPVVSVVWAFNGLAADEMEGRIVGTFERAAHHHGQRHRAHRVAIARGRRRGQGLLPPGRADSDRAVAGDRHLADLCCACCRPASRRP